MHPVFRNGIWQEKIIKEENKKYGILKKADEEKIIILDLKGKNKVKKGKKKKSM